MMRYFRYLLYIVDSWYRTVRFYFPWLWIVLDTLTLFAVDIIRLSAGTFAAKNLDKCNRPKKPLELYEFEGCPFCRTVRETLSCLEIDHVVYPCPRETLSGYGVCLNSRFRPKVKDEGGFAMFPFLVDPNNDKKMYQSADIVSYLWATYGDKASAPLGYKIAFNSYYQEISRVLVTLCRPSFEMGIMRAPARNPAKPLELWGCEGSPFVRRVREVLCILELPYLNHVVPLGSTTDKKRAFMKEQGAKCHSCIFEKVGIPTPYLYDPNTDTHLSDSQKIVRYLKEKYKTAEVPAETWLDAVFST